ncbi:hypothetical protein CYLTODRAFT_417698 [Cylindrobasidium torrendii FP15055 ss-10]|uniref:BUB1 N-terminal domain-containing protein n=1 Tax=Cylindrobasidium torrendii FP15055 ss-10 TaxID=1314674 RepID=A0A0D7BSX9_9AGAR|nr:hypothetical protein CYLTODRAFT_417698 [Cylindrobasidium torrendii FP15055 ss-10]
MSGEEELLHDTPVVDADVLEAAKENVQPLATGRRVTALSSLLATPHAHRESRLTATRRRLQMNVEVALEDDEDDPLEAYWALVNWVLENYPQGQSAESGLLDLLEEATRKLRGHRDGIWHGEIKYLKLWLLYASYVEKPTVIYRFLVANEIGTNHSLLYEEFSAVLERDLRRQEADDIYRLGIARRATPLDHLKSRHQDFQKRMMTAAPVPASASSSGSRGPAPLATTVDRTPAIPLVQRAQPSGPNAPVPVFVDPSGSRSRSALPEQNQWPDIGTRKTRVKENTPQTKSMAGSKLKQKTRTASGSGASGSRIMPFRDPEPTPAAPTAPKAKKGFIPFMEEDPKPAASAEPAVPATPKFTPFRDDEEVAAEAAPAHTPPENVMKARIDHGALAEAEALRKDPLKNYGEEGLGFDDP